MLALDAGCCLGLAQKPGLDLGTAGPVGQQHLDGHALLQLQMRCGQHHAHAPLTEHAIDSVLAEQHLTYLILDVALPSIHL